MRIKKNHFHITTFALNVALKQRPLGNPEMAFY